MGGMRMEEDIRSAPEDTVVCYCSNVTKGEILSAIREGAKDMNDIKAMTGACTVGRCKELSPRKR